VQDKNVDRDGSGVKAESTSPREPLSAADGRQSGAKRRDALHLWRTLRLVWHIAPWWTAAQVILALVQGILPLVALLLYKEIVDAVIAGASAEDKAAAFQDAGLLIVLAGVVGLAMVLARSVTSLVSEAQAQLVTDHISDIIHGKSVAVDLEYYENSRYYDVLHRAQQEAPFRPTKIINDLVTVGQSGTTVIGVAGLLFSLHWVVGVIVVAAAIPSALVKVRFSGHLYRWQRSRSMADRQSWYLHSLLTDGTRAKEVRLFDLGDFLRTWFRELRNVLRRERLALATKRSAADLGAGAWATVAVFGTFAFIAYRTIQGAITVGSMVMYYQAFQTGLSSLQSMLGGLAALYEDNLFLTYFYEFLALEPRLSEPATVRPVPRPLREGLVFHDVSFGYPETERTALSDISLELRPGEVAALVGANGSGKTTLVKLLCRLYDPREGLITVDGVDLRELSATDLRRRISVIFQDFSQYQFSARRNIWIGNTALSENDPCVERAARDAGVHDAIAGLRNGYDTMLGKWFEDGEELSIGEWQKVALARAFVRDADILVLDEPTSALDPLSEWRVFEHIRKLAEGRAVLLISHRFSTVHTADRIHILEQGRIVESGNHAELIALDGMYARMYEVQARAYQRELTSG
jgi:ATP-binding cassette subfamily B protein